MGWVCKTVIHIIVRCIILGHCKSNTSNILIFSTGVVMVIELNISDRGGARPERLRTTGHHKHATVTHLRWSPAGSRLFCGDNSGKVSVAIVPTAQVG